MSVSSSISDSWRSIRCVPGSMPALTASRSIRGTSARAGGLPGGGLELALAHPVSAPLEDAAQLPQLPAGLEQRLRQAAPLAGVEALRVADDDRPPAGGDPGARGGGP